MTYDQAAKRLKRMLDDPNDHWSETAKEAFSCAITIIKGFSKIQRALDEDILRNEDYSASNMEEILHFMETGKGWER